VVSTAIFVPGTYQVSGITCTVASSPFGRITEGTINCTGGGDTFSATWYTGALGTNPFKTTLTAAGIDELR
jgi:hypothetical protein